MDEKIKVISMTNGRCGIDNDYLHLSRRWEGFGHVVLMTEDEVKELFYDNAFRNMIENGTLYLDSDKIKEEMGSDHLKGIKYIDAKILKELWETAPIEKFKTEISSLTLAQLRTFADYAILSGVGNTEKADILGKASGKNILKGQELFKQSKEA